MSLKIDNYERILMTVFDCSYADLELIANVRTDIIADCIESIKEELNWKYIDINTFMREVFDYKRAELHYIIDERKEELLLKEPMGLSEDELQELKDLSSLNPFDDINSFHNFADTSVYFANHEREYKKYFADAIESFEKDTGFAIE